MVYYFLCYPLFLLYLSLGFVACPCVSRSFQMPLGQVHYAFCRFPDCVCVFLYVCLYFRHLVYFQGAYHFQVKISHCLLQLPLPAVLVETLSFFRVLKVRLQFSTFSRRVRHSQSHLPCLFFCDVCACACDSCACVYAFSSFSCARVYVPQKVFRSQHGGRLLELSHC